MIKSNYKVVERRTAKAIFKIFFTFLLNDTVNSLILIIKKNRRYSFNSQKYIGINLGSSTDSPPRWIGISGGITIFIFNLPVIFMALLYPFTGRSKKMSFKEFYRKVKSNKVLHHNLFYGIPFRNNSIPNVFSSHFFEHLTYESARFLFSESYRVLTPGGTIRILVPSLEVQLEKMKIALQECDAGNYELIQPYITEQFVEIQDPFSYHRYMYTVDSLKKVMEKEGFSDVNEMTAGVGRMPDLNLLEKRKSIIVEAVKPLNN